jgi:streptogramin lyase
MQRDHKKVAGTLAGEFAMAPPIEKGRIWCMTLSIADAFAEADPDFNRSEFYEIALGNADHFASRDEFTYAWMTDRDDYNDVRLDRRTAVMTAGEEWDATS